MFAERSTDEGKSLPENGVEASGIPRSFSFGVGINPIPFCAHPPGVSANSSNTTSPRPNLLADRRVHHLASSAIPWLVIEDLILQAIPAGPSPRRQFRIPLFGELSNCRLATGIGLLQRRVPEH